LGQDAVAVLAGYRPRYARVAERAGLGSEFAVAGDFEVVERVEGIGRTDYYGLSGRAATAEYDPMTSAEFDRKLALLRACWSILDETVARVSAELRRGPRGGGWEKERIIRHVNGAEIDEFAPKVGVKVPWRPGTIRPRLGAGGPRFDGTLICQRFQSFWRPEALTSRGDPFLRGSGSSALTCQPPWGVGPLLKVPLAA
jgi:hypothetical protein